MEGRRREGGREGKVKRKAKVWVSACVRKIKKNKIRRVPLLFRHWTVGTCGIKDVHFTKPLDSDRSIRDHHSSGTDLKTGKVAILLVLGGHFRCWRQLAPLFASEYARQMRENRKKRDKKELDDNTVWILPIAADPLIGYRKKRTTTSREYRRAVRLR
jgi:hypothetical protein